MLSAARLEAQVLSEMALIPEARPCGDADSMPREALALTERRYPKALRSLRQGAARSSSRGVAAAESLARYRAIGDDVSGQRAAMIGIENQ